MSLTFEIGGFSRVLARQIEGFARWHSQGGENRPGFNGWFPLKATSFCWDCRWVYCMAYVLSVSKHGDRFVTWGPDGPAKLDFLELPAFFGPFIFTHSNMGLPSGWFSLAKEQHPQMSFSHRMGEFRLLCLITRGSRSNYVEIAMAMRGLRLLKMTCPPLASYGNGNPLGAYGNINLWPLWPLGNWFDPKHQIQPKLSKLSVWPISKWWQTWEISCRGLEFFRSWYHWPRAAFAAAACRAVGPLSGWHDCSLA